MGCGPVPLIKKMLILGKNKPERKRSEPACCSFQKTYSVQKTAKPYNQPVCPLTKRNLLLAQCPEKRLVQVINLIG